VTGEFVDGSAAELPVGTDTVVSVDVSFPNGSGLTVSVRYPDAPWPAARTVAARALDEARTAVRAVVADVAS
jgi:hypothetical protein